MADPSPSPSVNSMNSSGSGSSTRSRIHRKPRRQKVPAFSNPFPAVELPLEDLTALRQMGHAFIDETCEQFESFIRINEDRRLPTETWKLLREVEDTRIYAERKAAAKTRTGEAAAWDILLGVGSTVGQLDDVMYGVISPTVEQFRLRSAYSKDTLVNGAIMTCIEQPTVDDPFRTMNVRWSVKAFPAFMRAVAKNRDCVYLEATGLTSFSDGERVGYHILHSVDFPHFPRLPNYVRCNLHIVGMWRQRTEDRIEVYMRAFMDFKMKMLSSLAVRSMAQAISCVASYVHASQMKKLTWALRRPMDEHQGVRESFQRETHCITCGKEVTTTLFARTKHMCYGCGHAMCPTCTIKKTIYTFRSSGEMRSHRPTVCVACLRNALAQSAFQLAGEEVLDKAEPLQMNDVSVIFGDSSSSAPETESIFSSEADPDYPLLSPPAEPNYMW